MVTKLLLSLTVLISLSSWGSCIGDMRGFLLLKENPLFIKGGLLSDGQINYAGLNAGDIDEAAIRWMKLAKRRFTTILGNKDAATFENTVRPLILMDREHDFSNYLLSNLLGVKTNKDLEKIEQRMGKVSGAFYQKVMTNKKYYERLKVVNAHVDELGAEEQVIVRKLMKSMDENFSKYTEAELKRVLEISNRLTELSSKYDANIMSSQKDFFVDILVSDLKGVTDATLLRLKNAAKEAGLSDDLVRVYADPAFSSSVLMEVESRSVREKVWRMARQVGSVGALDNGPIVKEILKLKAESSAISKEANMASGLLEKSMAQKPEVVEKFLKDLLSEVMPVAKKERAELERYGQEAFGIKKMEQWDRPFLYTHLKASKFSFDDETLRQYFELNRVLNDGVFYTLNKMYGIRFEKLPSSQAWNDEVSVFKVYTSKNEFKGLVYFDLFARTEEKRGGAWNAPLKAREYGVIEGKRVPYQIVTLNLKKNNGENATLLGLDDLRILFHECGHMVHGLFQKTSYTFLTSTSRDFVEIPSQFFENFAFADEVISRIAINYKTGKKLDSKVLEAAQKSQRFQKASELRSQAVQSLIDLKYHSVPLSEISDLDQFEAKILAPYATSDAKPIPGAPLINDFGHIVNGGYSSQYYGYLWSLAYANHAWNYFKKEGIFNSKIIAKYQKHLLGEAGVLPEQEAFERFLSTPLPANILTQEL